MNRPLAILITSCFLLINFPGQAEIYSDQLTVISSGDPESNAAQSFIIIKEGNLLEQGIKHTSKRQKIAQQPPFVIEYTGEIRPGDLFRWSIKVIDKQHGTIKLISSFKGKGRLLNSGYSWKSSKLEQTVTDRHKLIFRPNPFSHQPAIYKKGKGPKGKRRKYGGGTRQINKEKFNPQFAYRVTLEVINDKRVTATHAAKLQMDRKDMIRQEYINHYDIKRYGRGPNGNIPIPTRDEISGIPARPKNLAGNPLTESKYQLIINDGMLELAAKISSLYTKEITELKASGEFVDLNRKKLKVPELKLWVTSGWRNPERNEWYSNAVNGIHQRGGAVDFVIMAPPNTRESSLGYWILWKSLQKNKSQINAFFQLETNGRPMTTREYTQDIEPKNGIPDAFDKADHLHANVKY